MKICGVVVLYNPDDDINNKIKSYINIIDKLFVVDNSNQDNSNILKNIISLLITSICCSIFLAV